ncbi:hypothetical protein H5410_046827 [Solanum commersonii]|uniref:Uncharacterized protein n=1 Tax=Solanum commersonii TaxID=4109 RepID=A0A9J5XDB3_SOLCO|nr:hypothetical protein H5410_046827 [Solanum commersonii]
MLEEIGGKSQANQETTSSNNGCDNLSESKTKKFDKLLKEAECKLYLGCKKFSKLSFVVKLLHLKVYNHWSNKSFNMLLELLRDSLPNGETLPKEHKNELLNEDVVNIEEKHREHFSLWFEGKVRAYLSLTTTSASLLLLPVLVLSGGGVDARLMMI